VKLLRSFHDEACVGHFSSTITAFKNLRQCYYYPSMFKDAYKWVVNYEKCKMFTGKPQLASFPLRLVMIEAPFHQWGLNFIGSINPPSSQGNSYILTTTYYFNKWVEAKSMKKNSSEVVCEFLKEQILVRTGVLMKLIMDNTSYFSSLEIIEFCYDNGIQVGHSSDYFPQGNGHAKSSNKNMINIFKKLVSDNKKSWHKKINDALWEDRTTPKRAIGISHFELVYGVEDNLPLPLELATSKLKTMIEDGIGIDGLEKRILYLTKLHEKREEMMDRIIENQGRVKKLFDKRARPRKFMEGDLVLLWDKRHEPRGMHSKFQNLWKGPFKIMQVNHNNSFKLAYPIGESLPCSYNGQDLKLYQMQN
jgi:hypothetical protein